MSDWEQPLPAKKFAIWLGGVWYGEGDTPDAAWHDAMHAAMWAKIRRGGRVISTSDLERAARLV